MSINFLTPREMNIILQAMIAISETDWIEDWEKHSRLGIYPAELDEVLKAWPSVDETKITVRLAINNSMNEICYGVPIDQTIWEQRFDFSREEAEAVYDIWKVDVIW